MNLKCNYKWEYSKDCTKAFLKYLEENMNCYLELISIGNFLYDNRIYLRKVKKAVYDKTKYKPKKNLMDEELFNLMLDSYNNSK